MLLIEYRDHDGGNQFRVWTEEDAHYGSFKVVSRLELKIIIRACTLMGGLCRPAEDAFIDPVNMDDFHPDMLQPHVAARERVASA